jgi:hypothetical protein
MNFKADLTLDCLLFMSKNFSTPVRVVRILFTKRFSPWYFDWKGKMKAMFLHYCQKVPECVIVIVGNHVFGPFGIGGLLDHLSQQVEVSKVKGFEASAEVSLFEVVWLPILCLFWVNFSQVFVVKCVNGHFVLGLQFVVFF